MAQRRIPPWFDREATNRTPAQTSEYSFDTPDREDMKQLFAQTVIIKDSVDDDFFEAPENDTCRRVDPLNSENGGDCATLEIDK
ncbi:uncharacterized protein ARMOST_02501 [Armillaria ostoyae]|uniref:Uncharacterized protein n=1 Tax=Armillaria ostoyae TaxID=47428 RepID=A0A284QRV3_ARMOS|nr:uncharacterized protein ARMOST_02501 [Armillaria ostoyae]